jgi:PIN domain nuclease of toxin-antitoxin system
LFDPENDLVLSVVSVWEMAIKIGLGKLTTVGPLGELIARQERELALVLLEVRREHALGVQILPPHHKDPFDRLLVSQCRIEGLVLVSADKVFDSYPVERIW